MSRKSRANKSAATSPEVIAPEVHPDPIVESTEVAADAAIDTQMDAAAEPVFSLTVRGATHLKPKRGFETVLLNELKANGGTAKDLVARMLASGEYAKVAPKAAENRPMKPVNFILKVWKSGGHVVVAESLALEVSVPEEAVTA